MAVETRPQYLPTIGVECHVQLNTATKLFAAVANDARQAPPNSLISHICVGMPGALPVLNKKALDFSVMAAFALNTRPQKFSKFDRKHYFYPDLPKGYQITQYDQPIISGGWVEINSGDGAKRIGITRVNLEEDAGKTTHPAGASYSLVDLNRAGTPLLEIVSEPEIHSAAQAKAFARELWLLMKYAGITDGDLYHGHVRFDVNVSLSQSEKLGTRAEVKNLNSFRSVENAVAFEIKRQAEILEKGGKVLQETRGWDEAKQKTTSQRAKEEAHDYRYFPEPDIPPVVLEDQYIDGLKVKLPKLPAQLRQDLSRLKLDPRVVEDLLDRPDLMPKVLAAIEKTTPENARRITFQLLEEPEALNLPLEDKIAIAKMVEAGELSTTAAKTVLKERLKSEEDPRQIATRLNLLQVSDQALIDEIVKAVIQENPKAAEDLRNGELKAIGFLVGQVMKKSQGKANPSMAQQMIKRQLGIE